MSVDFEYGIRDAISDSFDESLFRGDRWGIYDSPIMNYDHAFRSVLAGNTISGLVADRVAETGRTPFVIDFMASTAALRSLSRSLRERHGVTAMEGVSTGLTDQRLPTEIVEDKQRGIVHVPGNLLRPQTRRLLRSAIAERPADVVMERAVAGLCCLPKHSTFYSYAFDALWSMLARDGGQMFLQVHEDFLRTSGLPTSTQIARDLRGAGIEAASGPSPESDDYSVMYVRRTSDVDIERPSELLR